MRGLFTVLFAFQLGVSALADEPAINVTAIRIDVARSAAREVKVRTQAFESGAGVWEKWSTETNRVFTNTLFLPRGEWLVFASRNGRRWHFVRRAPQGLFQFRYARGVSPPVLQLLFIKRNEN